MWGETKRISEGSLDSKFCLNFSYTSTRLSKFIVSCIILFLIKLILEILIFTLLLTNLVSLLFLWILIMARYYNGTILLFVISYNFLFLKRALILNFNTFLFSSLYNFFIFPKKILLLILILAISFLYYFLTSIFNSIEIPPSKFLRHLFCF